MPERIEGVSLLVKRSGGLRLKLILLSYAAGTIIYPQAAAAQTAADGAGANQAAQPSQTSATNAPQDENRIADIIVTAQKRSEAVNTVPMSITAATGAQLAQRGIVETRDLSKLVAGFTYAASQFGTPVYTLRGIGYSDVSIGGRPTVSIYNDEAPIPLSIETLGTQLDLERVEVLKGPQGILFGQNATGGAINYIAAKPTDTFQAGVNMGVGSFGSVDAGAFVSGPITSTLNGRIAIDNSYQGDWQKSYTTNATLGSGGFLTGRVILDWKPAPGLKVQLNVNGWHDTRDTQAAQAIALAPSVPAAVPLIPGLADYPMAPDNNRAADWDPSLDFHQNNRFIQANLRVDYDLSQAVQLTSLTSYSRYLEQRLYQPNGLNLPTYSNISGRVSTIYQELRASVSAGPAKLIVGGNFERDKIYQSSFDVVSGETLAYSFTALGLPVFKDFIDYTDQTAHSYAGFGNLDLDLTDKIKLYGGARYTQATSSFTGCSRDAGDGNSVSVFIPFYNFVRSQVGLPLLPDGQPGQCLTANPQIEPAAADYRLSEHNVSFRAGADWKPAPHTLLYANVSKGYKQGNFPSFGATSTLQYLPAKQESVLAYEAGFKLGLLHQTLQLNGAVFHYDYRDKQISGYFIDQLFGPINRLVNVPKSRLNGAEIELTWAPVRGLTINGNASYIDTKILDHFTNFNALAVEQDFGGEPFPNTPKWQANGAVEYQFGVGSNMNLFLGGDVTYQSKTNAQLGELALTRVNAYALLGAHIGLRSPDDSWQLMIFGKNLTDHYYWTGAYRTTDTFVRYAGQPMTFGAKLQVRFR